MYNSNKKMDTTYTWDKLLKGIEANDILKEILTEEDYKILKALPQQSKEVISFRYDILNGIWGEGIAFKELGILDEVVSNLKKFNSNNEFGVQIDITKFELALKNKQQEKQNEIMKVKNNWNVINFNEDFNEDCIDLLSQNSYKFSPESKREGDHNGQIKQRKNSNQEQGSLWLSGNKKQNFINTRNNSQENESDQDQNQNDQYQSNSLNQSFRNSLDNLHSEQKFTAKQDNSHDLQNNLTSWLTRKNQLATDIAVDCYDSDDQGPNILQEFNNEQEKNLNSRQAMYRRSMHSNVNIEYYDYSNSQENESDQDQNQNDQYQSNFLNQSFRNFVDNLHLEPKFTAKQDNSHDLQNNLTSWPTRNDQLATDIAVVCYDSNDQGPNMLQEFNNEQEKNLNSRQAMYRRSMHSNVNIDQFKSAEKPANTNLMTATSIFYLYNDDPTGFEQNLGDKLKGIKHAQKIAAEITKKLRGSCINGLSLDANAIEELDKDSIWKSIIRYLGTLLLYQFCGKKNTWQQAHELKNAEAQLNKSLGKKEKQIYPQ